MEKDNENDGVLTVCLPICPEGYEQVQATKGPSMQFNSFPRVDDSKELEFGQVFGKYPG